MSAIAAAITVAAYSQYDSAKKARDQAASQAAEQARIQQEAENARIAAAEKAAAEARAAEQRRQAAITEGAGSISGIFNQFDDNFYNKRSQDYINYAQPELDRQYQNQQRDLITNLARSGNLNSSLRGDLLAELQRQYDTGKLQIADTANKYAQDARASVEAQRASLLESNSQLADPGLVTAKANAAATSLGTNPTYASLGELIANLATNLSASPAKTAAAGSTSGSGVNLYDSGSTGSGKIVA